jgi:hypothetical protein
MGIYRVRNLATHRSLVGSSPDVPSMLNRQRAQLRTGGHPRRALQQEWNELGPDAFAFETLDLLDPVDEAGYDPTDDLKALEALWCERLAAEGVLFYR